MTYCCRVFGTILETVAAQFGYAPIHNCAVLPKTNRNLEENIMMDALKKSAQELLESCGDVTVASVNEEGYPRICVVAKLKSEGFQTIYFSTGSSGTKTRHFRKNPKSSVCYYKDGNSVTLVGEVEIVEDMNIKKSLWFDWMIEHFPGGVTDSENCVLKFTGKEATVWIDKNFQTFSC